MAFFGVIDVILLDENYWCTSFHHFNVETGGLTNTVYLPGSRVLFVYYMIIVYSMLFGNTFYEDYVYDAL